MLDFIQIHSETIKDILATAFFPALLAFAKSELMALNTSSQANGIWHFFKLAKGALKAPRTQGEHPMIDFVKKLEESASKIEEVVPKLENGLDRLAKVVEKFAPLIERFAPLLGKDGVAVAEGAGLAGNIAQVVDQAIPDQPQ